MADHLAPGHPGIPPRWTSSAKSGVGTAAAGDGQVWFTISHGIVNEVYFPRLDQANTRDCGLLVTDGTGFFSEEKRHAVCQIQPVAQGVPGYQLINTCTRGRYRVSKLILTDPHRDVLLQRVRFEALQGRLADYRLYVLLAPHIGDCGAGNSGWVGQYKGLTMLVAERDGTALALACSTPFKGLSCGYVGVSDGWQDIRAHGRMTWFSPSAPNGNIALTGEIDLASSGRMFVLALGFGRNAAEAGHQARAALLEDFDRSARDYVDGWQAFQSRCVDLDHVGESGFDLYRVSTAVLKTHQAKHLPGGMIASLSIPWGFEKGDEDLGGYHLVWPRDLVESAGGLLAAGDAADARRALLYLMSTQDVGGSWPQNMWLDGTPYWSGVQMDETAFPILLAGLLRRAQALDGLDAWPMVRAAADFLLQNGPVTQQDRWEEDGGYSPFTLMPSTSSCYGRCATGACSTRRRNPSSAIAGIGFAPRSPSGASITNVGSWLADKPCGSKCWRPPTSIGVWTAGTRCRILRRRIVGWAYTISTCPLRSSLPGRPSCSPSSGRWPIGGKDRTLPSR